MILFTKDCMVGIEMIDEDHRVLFDLINQANQLLSNELILDKYDRIKQLIDELLSYASEHFAREEAYMEKINDPEIIMQRVQHDVFRAKVTELSIMCVNTDEEQREVMLHITDFLGNWLYKHILTSDIMIGHLPPIAEWMVKENPCEFLDEYKTGIDLVDSEHATLFEITDKAYKMLKNTITREDVPAILAILTELRKYTAEHFADEEEYMESIHYDGLENQKRAHQAFIAEIDGIQEKDILKKPQEYMESIIEFLLGWLINHILKVDHKIPVQ